MKVILFLAILSLFSLNTSLSQPEFCDLKNTSTKQNEKLIYKIFYTLAGAYVGAGEVVFENNLETYQHKSVWHITGKGRTYSSYDWFFKVRDTYETFIDTLSMMPLKFIRDVNEGGKRTFESILFNHDYKTAVSTNGVFSLSSCTQDVLSVIYNARNINFNKYTPGEKIPVILYLEDKEYQVYIRYLGKEILNTKYGQYKTIKFRPLLIEGTIFKGGERMEVWVTDDANKLPVLVNTPILVGDIKAFLIQYSSLRNPAIGILKRNKN